MKFKIPKQFDLIGRTIKVRNVERCMDCDSSVDGQAIYSNGIIELKISRDQCEEYKEFVFFHELVHHLLNAIAYDKLTKDETFTDRLAGVLYQAIKTMK